MRAGQTAAEPQAMPPSHPFPLLRVPAGGPTAARQPRRTDATERLELPPLLSTLEARPAGPLPLYIPERPTPTPVQRVESSHSASDASSAEATSESVEESAEVEGPDLEELARQVYPYLRRRLSVERERIGRG
jgi:hypothetical protein